MLIGNLVLHWSSLNPWGWIISLGKKENKWKTCSISASLLKAHARLTVLYYLVLMNLVFDIIIDFYWRTIEVCLQHVIYDSSTVKQMYLYVTEVMESLALGKSNLSRTQNSKMDKTLIWLLIFGKQASLYFVMGVQSDIVTERNLLIILFDQEITIFRYLYRR